MCHHLEREGYIERERRERERQREREKRKRKAEREKSEKKYSERIIKDLRRKNS